MKKFEKPFKKELTEIISKTSHLCASILREYKRENGDFNNYQVRIVIGNHIVILREKTSEIEGEEAALNTDVVNRVMRDFYIGVISNLINNE